jgi:hypothetical protein
MCGVEVPHFLRPKHLKRSHKIFFMGMLATVGLSGFLQGWKGLSGGMSEKGGREGR